MLQVGDYTKFSGGQRHLREDWWKVTGIEGTTVSLVDRTGATARVRTDRRFHEQHAKVWEPGDPK